MLEPRRALWLARAPPFPSISLESNCDQKVCSGSFRVPFLGGPILLGYGYAQKKTGPQLTQPHPESNPALKAMLNQQHTQHKSAPSKPQIRPKSARTLDVSPSPKSTPNHPKTHAHEDLSQPNPPLTNFQLPPNQGQQATPGQVRLLMLGCCQQP